MVRHPIAVPIEFPVHEPVRLVSPLYTSLVCERRAKSGERIEP